MLITLEYTAQLRRAAGCRSEQFDLPAGGTLLQLLHLAAENHAPEFRQQLFTLAGERQPALLLFLRDQQLPVEANPVLTDGDCVTIMSPISGG